MKTRVLLLLLICSCLAKAQNIEVSGLQSGVWEADTVFVTDNVIVEDALQIAAGTTVIFNGFYGIHVKKNASLQAIGTRTDSICFTVTDTTNFHIPNSGRGGWNGIRLEKSGNCRFDYCRLQYSKAALDDDKDGGALRIYYCNEVQINNSTLFCNFSRQHGGALNAEHSNVTMHDCNVSHNLAFSGDDATYGMYGGGLRFINCEVEFLGTSVLHNTGETAIGGGMSIDSCSIRIDRCIFEYNLGINGGGLYLIRCYDRPCSITNSLFAHNTSGHFGGGLAICESSPLVANLTVANNHSIGVNCGGIFFYQHSSPAVWNCIVYGNTNEAELDTPVQMWSWTYEDDAPEFHNCLVQFGLENIASNDRISVYENCIDADPIFDTPIPIEYYIWYDSPCYNAGSPDTPIEVMNGQDLSGTSRVWWGAIDIGAYELAEYGIHETAKEKPLIRIVGNPITASSFAEIEMEKASDLTANIYSLDGKLLVNKPLGHVQKGTNRIEIAEMFQQLTNGTYLFVVNNAGKTFATKVVKP